ncbi:Hypothetical protein AA314_04989 [Archangium gephyra]|uniref:Uncharacterized protein n=1 Tax=Archangium gephyra TaxID=48 RepID=A0AAC8Q9A1_9BACT|nr:Hypothetical protein AA314_04989 [Archangium gephyra]
MAAPPSPRKPGEQESALPQPVSRGAILLSVNPGSSSAVGRWAPAL